MNVALTESCEEIRRLTGEELCSLTGEEICRLTVEEIIM